MNITTLPLGMLQTNCYILSQADRCLVIDPGDEPDKVLAFLEKQGLTLEAILLTHGHFDSRLKESIMSRGLLPGKSVRPQLPAKRVSPENRCSPNKRHTEPGV